MSNRWHSTINESKVQQQFLLEKSASSIPAIRDRVVKGTLKLIMEPLFEADF